MDATEILPGLMVGSHPPHGSTFSDYGVRAVVNVDHTDSFWGTAGLEQPFESLYVHFPFDDGTLVPAGMVRAVAALVARLVRDEVPTLVHCGAGCNRSGLVVARALMLLQGIPPEDAIEWVRRRRPNALFNPAFRAWLMREGPSLAADLAREAERG